MSLTDTLGSLAVASQGQYMTGVSTDISTSFVKPAGKPGDELRMVATLTAMGTYIAVFPSFGNNSVLRLFCTQESRWRTRGSISPTQRGSWLPTGVSLHAKSSVVWLTEVWLAHTKYVGKSIGHSVRHLFLISCYCPLIMMNVGEHQILPRW